MIFGRAASQVDAHAVKSLADIMEMSNPLPQCSNPLVGSDNLDIWLTAPEEIPFGDE